MNQQTEVSNPKGLTEGAIINTDKGQAKFIRWKSGQWKDQSVKVQIGRTELWLKEKQIKKDEN